MRCTNLDLVVQRPNLDVRIGMEIDMRSINNSKTVWVIVSSLEKGSLGHACGLQVNDRIIAINGVKCRSLNDLVTTISPLLTFKFQIKRQMMREVIKYVPTTEVDDVKNEEDLQSWLKSRKVLWDALRSQSKTSSSLSSSSEQSRLAAIAIGVLE